MNLRKTSRAVIPYLMIMALLVFTPGCLFFPRKSSVATKTARPGSIEGVVRYLETGQPAVGAAVSTFGSQTIAMTDSQGRFSIRSAMPGWQTVMVRKNGYLLGARTFALQSGQEVALDIDLQLADGHLHGTSARVQPGLCGSCHKLHSEPMLIGGTVNYACFQGCHDSNPRYSKKAVYDLTLHSANQAADPGSPVTLSLSGNSRGDCTNCHDPHGVTNLHSHLLTRAAENNSNPVCFACHASGGSGHTLDWPGQLKYEQTGNPHYDASPTQDVLANYPNSEAHKGECYNCHNPHGQQKNSNPLTVTTAMARAEEEQLCIGCHTTFAPRVQNGTKHACSLCHNPHLIKEGGVTMVKEPGVANTRSLKQVTQYKGTHRGISGLLKNEYCLGCHNSTSGNPYLGRAKDPLGAVGNTKFVDTRSGLRAEKYRHLHNVHVIGPIGVTGGKIVNTRSGGGSGSGYGSNGSGSYSDTGANRYCYPAGYGHETSVPNETANKVWCVDCHDPHPSCLTSSGQPQHHLLKASRILVANNGGGTGYNGKGSCSMTNSDCHAGVAVGDSTQNGCDWCHRVGSGGSPGLSCDCMTPCTSAPGGYSKAPRFPGDYPSWWSGSGGPNSQWVGHGHTHHDKAGITGRYTVEF